MLAAACRGRFDCGMKISRAVMFVARASRMGEHQQTAISGLRQIQPAGAAKCLNSDQRVH